ncbi:MAG: DUF6868 family protein [Pirellulaceae bacterium]
MSNRSYRLSFIRLDMELEMALELLVTQLLGWCTVINFGLLLLSTIALLIAGPWAERIHGKLFKLPSEELRLIYFRYLATMKLLWLFFNLTPYLALRLFILE